jgi:prepilin-type N-terminal cleavage/methylation domain-containing protein
MILGKSMLQKGFTLVEIAIVLVIFGLLLSALLLPLRAQREQAAQAQTISRLDNAKQALIGFVQANGRLPCPATDVSNGIAAPNASGPCTTQLGFLPAASLGIQPTDAQGFAVDAWDNRIMYAVTQSNQGGALTPDYTTNNDINDVGIVALSQNTENLRVCSSDVGVTATRCSAGAETNFLINNAVAVIYSTGATGSVAPGGPSEAINPSIATNPKIVFVSRDISILDPPNEFDHLVTWISPYVLYNAMIQAGQLH